MSCSLVQNVTLKEEEETVSGTQIVLGSKIQNPYSLSSARSVNASVEANYLYFKIRTDDAEKVKEYVL